MGDTSTIYNINYLRKYRMVCYGKFNKPEHGDETQDVTDLNGVEYLKK